MNYLFTYKARIILFSLLTFYGIAQGRAAAQDTAKVAKADTALNKKASVSQLIKADTALVIKAGATLVHKADTTMIIDPDGSLAKKFNEIVAAKEKEELAKNGAKVDSALIKPSTTPQQNAVNPPAPVSISPVTTTGATGTVISTPVPNSDASLPKNDASQPAATNTQQQSSGSSAPANTTTQQRTDSAPANTTTQQRSDSSAPANTNTQQSSATDQSATKKDNATQPAATPTDQSATKKDDATQPASTTTDQSAAKKDDATQPVTGQPAQKADSALAVKTDTTIKKNDTIPAKKDTVIKKSDTTMMVSDTSKQIIKAQNGYIEVGGAGLSISANYDTRFHKERNGWGYRVGLGFFSSGGNTVFSVPFQINYLLGNHAAMLELGAGTTFLNSTGTNIGNSKWEFDKVTGFIATATIGFRYQPEHKGLNFRIGFVPILYDEGLIPAGGASIGWTFK